MAMLTNKRKSILKKILVQYDENYVKVLAKKKKGIFECEMLKNYKKVRIDNYRN